MSDDTMMRDDIDLNDLCGTRGRRYGRHYGMRCYRNAGRAERFTPQDLPPSWRPIAPAAVEAELASLHAALSEAERRAEERRAVIAEAFAAFVRAGPEVGDVAALDIQKAVEKLAAIRDEHARQRRQAEAERDEVKERLSATIRERDQEVDRRVDAEHDLAAARAEVEQWHKDAVYRVNAENDRRAALRRAEAAEARVSTLTEALEAEQRNTNNCRADASRMGDRALAAEAVLEQCAGIAQSTLAQASEYLNSTPTPRGYTIARNMAQEILDLLAREGPGTAATGTGRPAGCRCETYDANMTTAAPHECLCCGAMAGERCRHPANGPPVGWEDPVGSVCAVCKKPSGMYGHPECPPAPAASPTGEPPRCSGAPHLPCDPSACEDWDGCPTPPAPAPSAEPPSPDAGDVRGETLPIRAPRPLSGPALREAMERNSTRPFSDDAAPVESGAADLTREAYRG